MLFHTVVIDFVVFGYFKVLCNTQIVHEKVEKLLLGMRLARVANRTVIIVVISFKVNKLKMRACW